LQQYFYNFALLFISLAVLDRYKRINLYLPQDLRGWKPIVYKLTVLLTIIINLIAPTLHFITCYHHLSHNWEYPFLKSLESLGFLVAVGYTTRVFLNVHFIISSIRTIKLSGEIQDNSQKFARRCYNRVFTIDLDSPQ